MSRLAAILICAAKAQWQGHGSRARQMASPFSATGDSCPCFFAARCPAPGLNFSRQLIHYGFAPDTGRASKHHSYEDHGSKPECPGLHE